MQKTLILIFIQAFILNASIAETDLFYKSTRGLGMGGAQISAVNDETTVLINPAALGKLRGNTYSFSDLEIEYNADTIDIIGADYLRALDPQKVLDDMNANPDSIYHARVQSFHAYARRNFSIGLFGNYSTDAQMDSNPGNPFPFSIDYKNDLAIVLGFNKRFFEGRLKIGVNVRGVNRMELKGDFQSFYDNLSVGVEGREGIGIASDVGVQVALPWKWLPTLSAVLRDAGGTTYSLEEGLFNNDVEDPEDTAQTLDVGFALFPINGNFSRFTFTGEYRDLLSQSDLENEYARYHLGLEWNSYDKFFLRAGMNQGYWTAGMELIVLKTQIQLASFGQEVGDANKKKESRNFILKVTLRF